MNAKTFGKIAMQLVFVMSFAVICFVVLNLTGVQLSGPVFGQIAFLMTVGFSAVAVWEIGGSLNVKR